MAEAASAHSTFKKVDLTGRRFGRLVVLREAEPHRQPSGDQVRMMAVRCDCGKEKSVSIDALRRGATVSCGCFHREDRTKHGDAKLIAPEYRAWSSMIQRCENPRQNKYALYGGRGIYVCARWRNSYVNFLADVGRRPSPKHSLDRFPDTDGNYEPGNVRWADTVEQRRNQRRWLANNP